MAISRWGERFEQIMSAHPLGVPPQTPGELVSQTAWEIETQQIGATITEGVDKLLSANLSAWPMDALMFRITTGYRLDLDGYLVDVEVRDLGDNSLWKASALIPDEAIVRECVDTSSWGTYMRNWVRTELAPKVRALPPVNLVVHQEPLRGRPIQPALPPWKLSLEGASASMNEFSQRAVELSQKAEDLQRALLSAGVQDQMEEKAAIESIMQVLREPPDPETP